MASDILREQPDAKELKTFRPEREQDQIGSVQHLQAQRTRHPQVSGQPRPGNLMRCVLLASFVSIINNLFLASR